MNHAEVSQWIVMIIVVAVFVAIRWQVNHFAVIKLIIQKLIDSKIESITILQCEYSLVPFLLKMKEPLEH